jgi:hypothetical protein
MNVEEINFALKSMDNAKKILVEQISAGLEEIKKLNAEIIELKEETK